MIQSEHMFITLKTSRCYFYFTIIQLFMTLFLLICYYQSWFEVLSVFQILVAFLFSVDIIIRYFAQDNFLKIKGNILDLTLLSVITIMIMIDLYSPKRFHHSHDFFALVFIAIRYTIQFIRFILILKNSHLSKEMRSIKQITFANIDKNLDVDDEFTMHDTFSKTINQKSNAT